MYLSPLVFVLRLYNTQRYEPESDRNCATEAQTCLQRYLLPKKIRHTTLFICICILGSLGKKCMI